jgi:hypothetical protein
LVIDHELLGRLVNETWDGVLARGQWQPDRKEQGMAHYVGIMRRDYLIWRTSYPMVAREWCPTKGTKRREGEKCYRHQKGYVYLRIHGCYYYSFLTNGSTTGTQAVCEQLSIMGMEWNGIFGAVGKSFPVQGISVGFRAYSATRDSPRLTDSIGALVHRKACLNQLSYSLRL